MSEWEIDGREVSSNSLWRVIEDFENGALSPEGREELLHILEESHRARAIYLEYFELSALLQIKAATQAEEGTLPLLTDRLRQRRVLRLSVLAAAAMLTLLAVVAAFVALNAPEPRQLALAASEGSAWSVTQGDGDSEAEAGVVVVEGSALHVSSGTVVLELKSGTRLVVQGPSRVRFPKLEEPVLEHGWLWADSAGEARELRITTNGFRFENIGTRFGVRVRDDGKAELHVMEGIVEVFVRATGRKTKIVPGRAGLAMAADGGMEGTALVADPFPGLPALMKAEAEYSTIVLGQAPSGYWRLDETRVGEAGNEVHGGSTGRWAQSVVPTGAALRPSAGFGGFAEGNRAAYLPGEDIQSVLYNLDSPAGVSPQEGAVAFWFRHDPAIESGEVLWYAGVPEGRGLGPHDEMHAFLAPSGQVRFFMEAGTKDVLLTSPDNCADGRWHHVVASWSPGAVELYIDGKLAARDEEYRPATGRIHAGSNVRFGKTGSGPVPLPGELRYFRGWVDEIALWSRPLGSTEVDLQFRAARGLPDDRSGSGR